jgi:hypothetical protein
MYRHLGLLLLSVLLPALPVFAQSTDDAQQILRDAALLGRFSSLEVHLTLEINERRGTKERDLVAYVERGEDETRALVQVVAPAFLNNLKFLSITSGDDRNQWMSTSRGVRRVAAGNRDERLFDSDFTVEDLYDYNPDDYDVSILGSERVNGLDCHVVQAVPRDSGFGDRKILYVAIENGLLQGAEFYSDGALERRFELLDTILVDGTPFPGQARMTTVESDTNTLLTVTEATTGIEIPDRIFNRGNL